MKKRGYTLAEALIALTVIGIIAALVAPMANKFKPDTNKVMFLKTYDAIAQATREMASNTQFYPTNNFNGNANDDTIIYTEIPLFNTDFVINADGENYNGASGNSKYCRLLSAYLNGENTNCSVDFKQIPDANEAEAFTTRNGAQFWVYTEKFETGDGTGRYRSNIYFDINGPEQGKNCTYEAGVCDRPDQFMLAVNAQGDVFPTDAMAERYVRTRNNYRQNNDIVVSNNEEEIDFDIEFASIPLEVDEFEPDEQITLSEGEAWADWVNLSNLRTTERYGVYCEQVDQDGGYQKQRHVYWHTKANAWVELVGVYHTRQIEGNGKTYERYGGENDNKINYNYPGGWR